MLEVTRKRLLRAALPLERVEFVRAELPAWNPPRSCYDLVATIFSSIAFRASSLLR